MKKRTYIQPEMEMAVLPEEVIMLEPNPASGGSFPSIFPSNPTTNPAPKRLTEIF